MGLHKCVCVTFVRLLVADGQNKMGNVYDRLIVLLSPHFGYLWARQQLYELNVLFIKSNRNTLND